ncbi:DUF3052 domain-containing protein [Alkalihalobacillus sp. AL-G]|uniref:DUF3052 domain-containing protein n=1 Tax=Alkalihalobacillus sp. AL-G TaxID=2926399 RepID=UPI00272D30DB|nr:DUF3052 domain-containing protein [Alkalihalobacillus sp. AL-G]WLD92763.1 DUF3052 domain-containing protein [Alkalihalobacillus sp. AL-G]
MHPLLKKMNYKNQSSVYVIKAPKEFETQMKEIADETTLLKDLNTDEKIGFVIVFCYEKADVEPHAQKIMPRLEEEALVWFAYPKKSSKRYKSDISRDTGWEPLGHTGFEPVRQVAIDEDWSALRFKNVDDIKTLTRNKKMTLSEKGKARKS